MSATIAEQATTGTAAPTTHTLRATEGAAGPVFKRQPRRRHAPATDWRNQSSTALITKTPARPQRAAEAVAHDAEAGTAAKTAALMESRTAAATSSSRHSSHSAAASAQAAVASRIQAVAMP